MHIKCRYRYIIKHLVQLLDYNSHHHLFLGLVTGADGILSPTASGGPKVPHTYSREQLHFQCLQLKSLCDINKMSKAGTESHFLSRGSTDIRQHSITAGSLKGADLVTSLFLDVVVLFSINQVSPPTSGN